MMGLKHPCGQYVSDWYQSQYHHRECKSCMRHNSRFSTTQCCDTRSHNGRRKYQAIKMHKTMETDRWDWKVALVTYPICFLSGSREPKDKLAAARWTCELHASVLALWIHALELIPDGIAKASPWKFPIKDAFSFKINTCIHKIVGSVGSADHFMWWLYL